MVSIRPATAADQRLIREWIRREGLDPTAQGWRPFLVAEMDGRVVGIGQVKHLPDCEELGSLTVLPEYRGQGIAAQLIEALEARAGRPLYLLCQQKLESYYAQFGYQRVAWGTLPRWLRFKMLFGLMMRVIGIRVVAMRKG